jgi:hypothetical protein
MCFSFLEELLYHMTPVYRSHVTHGLIVTLSSHSDLGEELRIESQTHNNQYCHADDK